MFNVQIRNNYPAETSKVKQTVAKTLHLTVRTGGKWMDEKSVQKSNVTLSWISFWKKGCYTSYHATVWCVVDDRNGATKLTKNSRSFVTLTLTLVNWSDQFLKIQLFRKCYFLLHSLFTNVQLPRLRIAQFQTEAQSLWDFDCKGDMTMKNHQNLINKK